MSKNTQGGNKMAFLDNIKNKALQAAQTAADKTKVMMEVSNLNGIIDTEKKQINSCFMKIGEISYENYPNGVAPQIEELIEQINTSKQKIVDCNEQIKKLKGSDKCEKCGANLMINCANSRCGESQFFENIKCTACGKKIKN